MNVEKSVDTVHNRVKLVGKIVLSTEIYRHSVEKLENDIFMLKLVSKMSDLDIKQLMAVYSESNLESGIEYFPDESADRQRLLAEDRFVDYLREDFFRCRGAVYALWAPGGRYVSALRFEPYRDGVLLEALETAPQERRKGYAVTLVQQVLEYLSATQIKKVYSHIHKSNIPSLKLHEKCGFLRISDSATYIDGTITWNSYTMCRCL